MKEEKTIIDGVTYTRHGDLYFLDDAFDDILEASARIMKEERDRKIDKLLDENN